MYVFLCVTILTHSFRSCCLDFWLPSGPSVFHIDFFFLVFLDFRICEGRKMFFFIKFILLFALNKHTTLPNAIHNKQQQRKKNLSSVRSTFFSIFFSFSLCFYVSHYFCWNIFDISRFVFRLCGPIFQVFYSGILHGDF